jgi:hypothetical protein
MKKHTKKMYEVKAVQTSTIKNGDQKMENKKISEEEKIKLYLEVKEEFEKIEKPAEEEYNQIVDSAWEKYNKIETLARKEYHKIVDPAWNERIRKMNEIKKM